MPITLKLGVLVQAKPALEKLVQLKFSMATSHKLVRRLRPINDALMNFDSARAEWVRELGTQALDGSKKFQLRQVNPEHLQKAKSEAAQKREDATRATTLYRTADGDTSKAKSSMESLVKFAEDAEAQVAALEKEMAAWTEFNQRTNDKMNEDVSNIDPIRLSELQPLESAICSKCGRSPHEISIEDMMLLYPFLVDDKN
jgi:hypothetical protein